MSKRNAFLIGALAGGGILVLGALAVLGPGLKRSAREEAATWNQAAIRATYVGSQLKEVDSTHSSLIVSYDVENGTDSDYRLADGPGVLILSRLKSDGSLSQEQPIRLSYPVFLPAKQHARLALEITQPFAWPKEEDPASLDKLRDFVRHRLENVGEFVVFDELHRSQIQLPGAWEELQDTSQGGD